MNLCRNQYLRKELNKMNKDLWHRLECECHPGFRYKSAITFGKHFDSQRHERHELQILYRQVRIQSGLLETKNIKLAHEKAILQAQCEDLNNRFSVAQKKLDAFRETLYVKTEEYNHLNKRFTQECITSSLLRVQQRQWAGYYLAVWIGWHWRSRTVAKAQRKIYFEQCMKHLPHFHKYREALRMCYTVIGDLSNT